MEDANLPEFITIDWNSFKNSSQWIGDPIEIKIDFPLSSNLGDVQCFAIIPCKEKIRGNKKTTRKKEKSS